MKIENVISYIVLLLSLINIYNHQNQLISLSVGLSVIGIVGFITFLSRNNLYKTLFFIWIIVQFPIIEISEIKNGIKYVNPIFDLSQAFRFKFGFGITYYPQTYNIGLNFIPFAFYALYKILIAKSLVSSIVTIIPISEQSPLAKFAPLSATIIDTESGFMVGELKERIKIDDVDYKKVLFKTQVKSIFKLKKPRQKCLIKLIPDIDGTELNTEGFIN